MQAPRLCLFLIAAPNGIAAQAPTAWLPVSTGVPIARTEPVMAFDSARAVTVLFGGYTTATQNDTWEWDGTAWTERVVPGPPPRASHHMVYDDVRGRAVLFGGRATGSGPLLGDTWEWNGSSWTQVAATGPAPRAYAGMAFDSHRGRTVLFAGSGNSGDLSDTWEWNGTNWLPFLLASGQVPAHSPAMAYDRERRVTVLFGGTYWTSNGGVYLDDTWEWNGLHWTQVGSGGPNARHSHCMVYDNARRTTVLFGGLEAHTFGHLLGDTWEWNGATWQQIGSTGPAPRSYFAMAYDDVRRTTVAFGGNLGTSFLDDTWELPSGPVSVARPYGTGCGTPPLDLAPAAGAVPQTGTTATVTLTQIPATVAFLALGWSDTTFGTVALPWSLAGFGLTGCDLLQSADIGLAGLSVTAGAATYDLAIPNWPTLVGLPIYLQGFANAPGQNAAAATTSNGIEWVIGSH